MKKERESRFGSIRELAGFDNFSSAIPMKSIHMITFLLLVIGGLNWLLVGLFGWDISRWLGGMDGVLPRIIYILVGLSAIVEVVSHKGNCCTCNGQACATK